MGLENLKRWHWIAFSLMLGLALSFLNAGRDPTDGLTYYRSILQQDFESRLVAKPVNSKGDPAIRNIVVYPAKWSESTQQWVRALSCEVPVGPDNQPVHGGHYHPRKGTTLPAGPVVGHYQRFVAVLPEKFTPRFVRPSKPDPEMTLTSFLDQVAETHPEVRYRAAWWAEPRFTYPLWIGGCLVVVGGIWPSIIGLLIGGGESTPAPVKPKAAAGPKPVEPPKPKAKPAPKPPVEMAPPVIDEAERIRRELFEAMAKKADEEAAAGKLADQHKGDYYPVFRAKTKE